MKNFVEKLQIEALHLFYCTQSKKKAIIDSQIFFPEIFKYSLITLITIPNPFQIQHKTKSEQDHLKVFFYFMVYHFFWLGSSSNKLL